MSRRPGLYALLLKAYPREYSAAHSRELLATLEESSGGRVHAREAAGLLIGALRQRRLSDQMRQRRITVMSAAWLAGLVLLGLGFAVGSAIAVMDVRAGGLQIAPRALGGLLSGVVLALALRGRVRAALTVLLLGPVPLSGLTVVMQEPSLALLSLVVPAIVLGVMATRQPFELTTHSWWWLAVPPLWGAGLMLSSSPVYVQVATLALMTALAGGEARVAFAAATVCLVLAADIVLSALVRFSMYGGDLETAAAMTGIAVFLALLGSPALTHRLTPAIPTA